MNLVKGEATVYPEPGQSFDPVLIFKAIHKAGFTATEVDAVLEGTLAAKNGRLELEVPGLKHPFILSGGPEEGSLEMQSSLVGKKIEVTGKIGAGHGGSPPSLTIAKFQPLD